MSTPAELAAVGRRVDAARARIEKQRQSGTACPVDLDLPDALMRYRMILEDITGQHADVILRRLSP